MQTALMLVEKSVNTLLDIAKMCKGNFDLCVEQVMAQGHDEDSAKRICATSLRCGGKSDEDIAKDVIAKADKNSEYINEDGTFKGGFQGCVAYMQNEKGLSEDSAKKLCAYIGRQAGKI